MKKLFLLLFFSFLFLFTPKSSFAEIIHSFDVDITSHKDGTMDFIETINYDFEESIRHGIFRYIPRYSSVGNLYRIINLKNVKVERDGRNENFTFSKTNEQFNLKIGNANKTITGNHVYKIYYTVENGIGSNFETHDEIYWNITGNGWDVTIFSATATLTNDFDAKPKELSCFTGPRGSTEKLCNVLDSSVSTSDLLDPSHGLTIVAVYQANTFPKSILSSSPPKTFKEKLFEIILSNYHYIFIFLNFILGGYLIYWYQKHKNKKRFGKPTVNFDIPKDNNGNILRPAVSGTIDTAMLQRDDVVSTIFDLAIRKYIKIEEEKTVRSMLPDSKKQTIIKLKKDPKDLEGFEKNLYNFLFETGDKVELSSLRLTFYKAYEKMEEDVFKSLVEKKYYIKNPKIQKGVLLTLSIFAFFTFNFILGIILLFLSMRLNGRTALGDEVDYKIDGLKLFLKSMDRNYKWQVKNFYTVEQMIPYAMALGYIDKFMEALKVIKPDYNPSWYSGYRGSFYGAYAGFYSSITTTVAPTSSSGSSGGFSGGGGGGGGGGSW